MIEASFCITCMGRLCHLKDTLPSNIKTLENYGIDYEICLVNWGSKDGLHEWIHENYSSLIKSKKIKYLRLDKEYFEMAPAKNAAHDLATKKFVCNLDADNYITNEWLDFCIDTFKCDERITIRNTMSEECGRIFLLRSTFIFVGGYDNKFVKWGGDDNDFLVRLRKKYPFPSVCYKEQTKVINHSNYLRVENIKSQTEEDLNNNPLINSINQEDASTYNYDILLNIIKQNINSDEVYYFRSCGNWGDGLIRTATLQFFKDNNIKYKEIRSHTEITNDNLVLYAGGGAWSKIYGFSYNNVMPITNKIIVLPSSYELTVDNENIIYFSRDKFESLINFNSYFCHDMSFYLKDNVKYDKGNGTLYAYRTDSESVGRVIPEGNRDISLEGNERSCGFKFLEEINKYEIIHTDRLHVAIAGYLLKKEVHLYPNAYFKNESVFKSSIEPFSYKVQFHNY